MRRGFALSVLFVLLLGSFAIAINVDVESASQDSATIYFSGLKTLDVVFENIQVVVETSTLTDTYIADYKLEVKGSQIFLTADLTDVYLDYSPSQIEAIIIRGSLDGEDFAKRVAVREGESIRFGAPTGAPSKASLVYWVIAIVLVIVAAALFNHLIHGQKQQRKLPVKKSRKKNSKKKVKKKGTKTKKRKKTKSKK
jgi:hypothetical protein